MFGSDLMMGEDEMNTSELESKNIINNQEIYKDKEEDQEDGWLRLSLGIRPSISSSVPGDETMQPTTVYNLRPRQQLTTTCIFNNYPSLLSTSSVLPTDYPTHYYYSAAAAAAGGLWFILQASQTQTKQPYLPQLPKTYLRIKDGRTTVGLILKYLVYKLKLQGEFEIGVTCKGKELLPFLSLQHVRDNIWNTGRSKSTDVVFLTASSCSVDHLIMVLNYGRNH